MSRETAINKAKPSSQKAARIRWAILRRIKRNIAGKGDNFVWVAFVRKDRMTKP